MRKKFYIIGVYPPPYGGVTVKCDLFFCMLKNSQVNVEKVDMYEFGRTKSNFFVMLRKYIKIFKSKDSIVYCLDSKRLRVVMGLQFFWKKSYERTTILATGGVFPETISKYPFFENCLKKCKGVWVETEGMKQKLLERGFENVEFFPNPKSEVGYCIPREVGKKEPLSLVYFSQISREKGVGDIIELVDLLNKDGNIHYQLDFYGPIVSDFKEEFEDFIRNSKNTSYCGVFDSTRSGVYKKLNEYDVLLFPTHWDTEGVPGILVEAKMSGLAVIASDKSYNKELIRVDNQEGIILCQPYSVEMYNTIKRMDSDRIYLQAMKEGSSKSRKRYVLEKYESMIEKL